MIGVDTNILLRWIAGDSLAEDAASHQLELVQQLANGSEELFVNQIVIVELVWVLRQRARLAKAAVAELVTRLLHATNIVVHERETLLAAVDSYSRFPGGFSDHLLGEINKRNGCRTTLTFDKAAAKSPHFSELKR
ncbi:type II toxin-antitoxin system VapC family toxin [Rhizobium sp. BG4]|uniref:PIN domain-containing protein n=1 Tax=Rhizobium sp. BG4 TaxID=2613770 RepID=UPI00193CFB71|nr:type II toxin-antitoxin system VapC family toxin [Rhizobium sp. BG4]QRM44492.1 type II toxin-antitoxin system VapC family toxin [Rhizobium sp. BG4]